MKERYRLEPEITGIGLVEGWDYAASVYLISERLSQWDGLAGWIGEVLEGFSAGLGGVSVLPVPGLAVKVLARSAPDLSTLLESVWAAARAEMGLPPANLRKY